MDDDRFAKNLNYVFMSMQYVERTMLESQINVSAQRGTVDAGNNVTSLSGAYSVFMKIKGTPKYWQHQRNELVAKVKQLGPFHAFFTLSCAEMRWSEVYVSTVQLPQVEPQISGTP